MTRYTAPMRSAFLALLVLTLSLPATAQDARFHSSRVQTVRYVLPPQATGAFEYRWFGGDEPLLGHIVATRVRLRGYTPLLLDDARAFHLLFAVPVVGGENEALLLEGGDMGWSGMGVHGFDFDTDAYNGKLRTGRFGLELGGGGTFVRESWLEFSVVPCSVFSDAFEADATPQCDPPDPDGGGVTRSAE